MRQTILATFAKNDPILPLLRSGLEASDIAFRERPAADGTAIVVSDARVDRAEEELARVRALPPQIIAFAVRYAEFSARAQTRSSTIDFQSTDCTTYHRL